MNNYHKNLKIQNFQELTQPKIEQKLILLKKERQNKKENYKYIII